MPRPLRADVADIIYHVINRANARSAIFKKAEDYQAFIKVLFEAREKFPVEILAFCLMPNHWHFILKPLENGSLSRFMAWLTMTHTQRWHAHYHTTGTGHLYQGRYKSFPVQTDEYFLQLTRYVEANPFRANLAGKAQNWQWGSLWVRHSGDIKQKRFLSSWPIPPTRNYLSLVNKIQSKVQLDNIRNSIIKNRPLGDEQWVKRTAEDLGLESSLRESGRPKKGS